MRRLKAGRVALSPQATEDLNFMIDGLKADGATVQGGPSDFLSLITSVFKEKFFEKEIVLLRGRLIDELSYVKSQISRTGSKKEVYEKMRKMVKEYDKEEKKSRLKAKSRPQNTQEIEVNL